MCRCWARARAPAQQGGTAGWSSMAALSPRVAAVQSRSPEQVAALLVISTPESGLPEVTGQLLPAAGMWLLQAAEEGRGVRMIMRGSACSPDRFPLEE